MSLLYPRKCLLCGSHLTDPNPKQMICSSCASVAHQHHLEQTLLSIEHLDGACASLYYRDTIAGAMKRYKFQSKRQYSLWFAAQTARALSFHLDNWNIDMMTYIPIGPLRKHQRGFNQSELIAKELSKTFRIPCAPLLKKRMFVRKQSQTRDAAARLENIRNAFLPLKDISLTGKSILLIDDVITTGATLSAAACVLRNMGADTVYGATPVKTP